MALKWIGKLTGGLLGALALGPLGAVLGVLLGHQVDAEDEAEAPPTSPAEVAAIGAYFFRATFRVMGYLAKADGRVSEAEILAARAVMRELRLAEAEVQEAIACFGAGKSAAFDLEAELARLVRVCKGRSDLLRVFLEIQVRAALAGNDLEGPVRPLMSRLAARLGISGFELLHIEAVQRIRRGAFHAYAARGRPAQGDRQLLEAYRVLDTRADASDEEVARAYRRALNRNHPDKLKANGLPESMLTHAKERTQQIIEAWELVRARRGMR